MTSESRSERVKEKREQRRVVYRNVQRHARKLAGSLDTEAINRKRVEFLRKRDRLFSEIYFLDGLTELDEEDTQGIALRYREAADSIEHAAYYAVALSEPLFASIYFKQAADSYSHVQDSDGAVESLLQRSLVCDYEHRRREKSCLRNVFGRNGSR